VIEVFEELIWLIEMFDYFTGHCVLERASLEHAEVTQIGLDESGTWCVDPSSSEYSVRQVNAKNITPRPALGERAGITATVEQVAWG
jgi:hypothetical protein